MKHAHDYVSDCECRECLLARARALSARVAELEAQRDDLIADLVSAQKERNALQRVIDEARGQEPVAWYRDEFCKDSGPYRNFYEVKPLWNDDGMTKPLYVAAIPVQPSLDAARLREIRLFCHNLPELEMQTCLAHIDAMLSGVPAQPSAPVAQPQTPVGVLKRGTVVWGGMGWVGQVALADGTMSRNNVDVPLYLGPLFPDVAQPAPAVADGAIQEALTTLRGIADATASGWEMPWRQFVDEFLPWAQSRARFTVAKLESVAPEKTAPAVADDVDLWKFMRDVLKRGAAIESQFSQQGYETFIAEIESAARKEDKRLRAMLAASAPEESKP